MLAENVSRVLRSRHVVETKDASGDGLSSLVVRKGIVALHDLGMRLRSRVDNCLVVSKHHGRLIHSDSEVPEGIPKVNDLLGGSPCRDVLGSKCSGLNRRLQLAEPIDGSLVRQMENTCHGATTDQIMVQVGVDVRGEDNLLSSWSRSIFGK